MRLVVFISPLLTLKHSQLIFSNEQKRAMDVLNMGQKSSKSFISVCINIDSVFGKRVLGK